MMICRKTEEKERCYDWTLPLHLLACAAAFLAHGGSAAAQTCTQETLGAAVDAAGVELRALNADAQPKLNQKITALKEKKKWSAAEYEQKVGAFSP